MTIDTSITEAFGDWLADTLTPANIRAAESGKTSSFTWGLIAESGFADLLVPESQGGGGSHTPHSRRTCLPVRSICPPPSPRDHSFRALGIGSSGAKDPVRADRDRLGGARR